MLDLTNCPYMWPYCTQPLYYTSMPVMVNATILNGMGVVGKVVGTPQWKQGKNGHLLELSFSYPDRIWPWTGWLGIYVKASEEAKDFDGEAEGVISVTVSSPAGPGESKERVSVIDVPLRVRIIPTPPREKRILFDQFHNLRYPAGYFPRDALWVKNEPFDWNGDHIHTNLRDMYTYLRSQGYFVEVLGVPYTCFNASNYGTLLMVDLEEEYFPEEVQKLRQDVEEKGLSIALFADWYNVDVMRKIKFFDENTKQWWTPATGGANVPALNDLLASWRIQFGDRIFDGEFSLGQSEDRATFASGTAIASFPRGGTIVSTTLDDQTEEIIRSRNVKEKVHILGLLSIRRFNATNTHGGRIAVFGDSSCLDTAHQQTPCFWLLGKVLQYTNRGLIDENAFGGESAVHLDQADYVSPQLSPPNRLPYAENDLKKFSRVLDTKAVYRLPQCEARDYTKFKREENAVTIVWDEPNTSSTDLDDDGFSLSETIGPDAALIRDNIDGYIVPYFLVVGVVVFLVYATVRGRKDRITAKRDVHNV
jgi:membrane-bound transcription factor site-1 protease